ncbi:hypothetical protein IV203_013400 [Nitzschia inconspicua]|uniref:Uncharacterized protein n=1 Tax=Nitzschia inconspicua TaxID=303405 RepID=A0A9K3Q8R6_9STRA|nr:hypothetical protein IV203_013400 [Nitzschia inconspicua]
MRRAIQTGMRRGVALSRLQPQQQTTLGHWIFCDVASSHQTQTTYRRHQSIPSSPSNSDTPDLSYIQQHYKVHRRGQPGHGSREYLLLPPHVKSVEQVQLDPTLPAAALMAHRNILFGARCFGKDIRLVDVCGPLVQMAVEEAEEYGEQPQAMANLKGLCGWVKKSLDDMPQEENRQESSTVKVLLPYSSQVLQELQETDLAALEAVQAIATGVPRPGHSVVGQGTYRDGQAAWEKLAKEYIELGLAEEANLYQQHRGRLVAIESMADTSPNYLKAAGGAMARFFFL